jgi:hypothetical protein
VNSKRLLTVFGTVVLLALPFLVFFKAQALVDWWALHDYSAPANVAALATDDKMTDYSRKIFYVNHPEITNNISIFRSKCPQSEQTIVLGCYRSSQQGIGIYDIQDARLNGVEQVTAAHEMLHAAYDRLSTTDRKNIDAMLQDYYDNQMHDQRIIDTINAYKTLEPNDVVNEMHSIFGTEVASLPPPLETYYKKYFVDRNAVVTYAGSYENEFSSRTDKINAYDAQLTSLKNMISSQQQQLKDQLSQIEADRARLDTQRSEGNVSEYNASVPPYNREVDSYNALIQQLKNNIIRYNDLVEQRNTIAKELRSLDSAIDSRSIPQTVQ